MPQTPRPDQRTTPGISGPGGGSRSGAGDFAGALGYPGVPPAALNCQSAEVLQQAVGVVPFFTFPKAARIWTVTLSYVITSNASYSLATSRTYARIVTDPGLVTLAIVNLGIANQNQHSEGQSEPPLTGLPVTEGESLVLDVNGGTTVPQMNQQASAVVLYSIP